MTQSAESIARSEETATSPGDEREGPGQLVRTAFDDLRRLVTLEVALARRELGGQLAQARSALVAFGAGALMLVVSLAAFVTAIALATSNPPVVALAIGGGLLAMAAGAGAFGWSRLPKAPMAATRDRLEVDVDKIRHLRS